jgi:hypothetical protein
MPATISRSPKAANRHATPCNVSRTTHLSARVSGGTGMGPSRQRWEGEVGVDASDDPALSESRKSARDPMQREDRLPAAWRIAARWDWSRAPQPLSIARSLRTVSVTFSGVIPSRSSAISQTV